MGMTVLATTTTATPLPGISSAETRGAAAEGLPFEEVLKETKERKRGSESENSDLAAAAASQLQGQQPQPPQPQSAPVTPDAAPPGSETAPCTAPAAPVLPDAGKVAELLTGAGRPADLSGQGVCPAPEAPAPVAAQPAPAAAALPIAVAPAAAPVEGSAPLAEAAAPQVESAAPAAQAGEALTADLKRAADQSYASTVEQAAPEPQPQTAAPAVEAALPQPAPAETPARAPAAAQPAAAQAASLQAEKAGPQEAPAQRAAEKPGPAVAPIQAAQGLEKAAAAPTVDIVNDPARLADVRSRELINQVAHHVEMSVSQGRNSLRIQLFPAEMGRIDLRLTGGANGLSITLIADQPATNQALMKQFDQLRQTLVDAGIQFTDLNIGRQASSFQQQSAGQDGSQPFHHSGPPRKETPLDSPETPVLKDARGRIDYRV